MPHQILGGPFTLDSGQVLPISRAIRAGDFVFLSGQLGLDESNRLVPGSIAEQTRQALDNVRRLLALAGCTLGHVVKVNAWVTAPEHFPGFNEVYARHFPASPPVRTSVCSALLLPGALVEIEVVAFSPVPS